MLGMELRKVPADDEYRMRVDALDLADAAIVVADGGDDLDRRSVDPVRPSPTPASADRDLAARRRRLRRLGDGLPRAPLGVRGRRARRLAGRQRAQVDAHADGLLAAVDEPARRLPRRLQPRPRVPAHARRRGRAQPQRVRPRARAPLPLAEAVGGPALLRPRRAAADDPRARAARRAVRGLGARGARLGAVRAAPLLRSSASAATAPTPTTRRSSSASTRAARSSSRTRGSTTATCCASRSARRPRRRTTCAGPGTRSARPR